MKSPMTTSWMSWITTTQCPTNCLMVWFGLESSLKDDAQNMNDMSLDSAWAARKCDVCDCARPSFINMKSCGSTVTDSKYKAKAQAMSVGMKLFKCGCRISAMAAAGPMIHKWLNVSAAGS